MVPKPAFSRLRTKARSVRAPAVQPAQAAGCDHFGGEFFLLDGEVGDAEFPVRSQHTGAFGQGARFARGEADHGV